MSSWQVSYFTRDTPAKEIAQVYVSDDTGNEWSILHLGLKWSRPVENTATRSDSRPR